MRNLIEMVFSFASGARINFLFEKRSKSYVRYGAVSIAEEKLILAQKILWRSKHSLLAERIGA